MFIIQMDILHVTSKLYFENWKNYLLKVIHDQRQKLGDNGYNFLTHQPQFLVTQDILFHNLPNTSNANIKRGILGYLEQNSYIWMYY